MGDVIQMFGDPSPLLEGEAREKAIRSYREAAAVVAAHVIAQAFSAISRMPGCGGLGAEDVLPMLTEAFRRELSKSGY